jgi:hypothetical protein
VLFGLFLLCGHSSIHLAKVVEGEAQCQKCARSLHGRGVVVVAKHRVVGVYRGLCVRVRRRDRLRSKLFLHGPFLHSTEHENEKPNARNVRDHHTVAFVLMGETVGSDWYLV